MTTTVPGTVPIPRSVNPARTNSWHDAVPVGDVAGRPTCRTGNWVCGARTPDTLGGRLQRTRAHPASAGPCRCQRSEAGRAHGGCGGPAKERGAPKRAVPLPAAQGGVSAHPPPRLMYNCEMPCCTLAAMDVAVSTLRAELADWIERVRRGEEVVVTDRGTPVARLIAVDTTPLLERLTREGVLGRPGRAGRPTASGASRARASRPVSELVSEQRR